eukprot:scaffold941_cov454-Pavlova_lutheri.AAC.2
MESRGLALVEDGFGSPSKAEGDTLVLEEGMVVSKDVYERLLPHQRVGLRWLWSLHVAGAGGILGDEMGLGKTVQVAALYDAWDRTQRSPPAPGNGAKGKGIQRSPWLVVCPPTLLHLWKRELKTWCGDDLQVKAVKYDRMDMDRSPDQEEEDGLEGDGDRGWEHAQVVLATYEQVRRSWRGEARSQGKKVELHHRTWEYAVLDEGHRVRNPDAQITLACKSLRTKHRLVLTGAPIQNHLVELWSVMDFAFPGRLGTLPVFEAHFAIPIRIGAYANATSAAAAAAFRCAVALKDAVAPYLLRRRKSEVKVQLPKRKETVLFCRLTPKQRAMYRAYLASDQCGAILERRVNALVGLDALRKICNHPELYERNAQEDYFRPLDAGDARERVASETDKRGIDICTPEGHPSLRSHGAIGVENADCCCSGKVEVLMGLLRCWLLDGHRVLVFTQTQQMLNLVQREVRRQGWKHLRMDGCTPVRERPGLVDAFEAQNCGDIFLLTTRVGGLGLSLVGADRVVLVDPDWNPATDAQAAERAWRIGQKRNVEVVRLVTAGTVEEKIYHRQIHKRMLTERVLRDPAQKRIFANKDLHDLFVLEEEEKDLSPLCPPSTGQIQPLDTKKCREPDEAGAQKRCRIETETERIFNLNGSLLALPSVHEECSFLSASEEGSKTEQKSPGSTGHTSRKDEATVVERLLEGDEAAAAKMLRAVVDHDDVTRAATVRAQGDADREARRVAQRAKEALLRSRKACYTQKVHVPTWTGRSGGAGGLCSIASGLENSDGAGYSSRMRVNPFPREDVDEHEIRGGSLIAKGIPVRTMLGQGKAAASLLQHIRLRDGDVPQEASQLQGIVEFLRKQPGKQASSQELVERFQERNEDVDPSLFKQLLKEAATLQKTCSSGGRFTRAMWKLKPCFQ